MGKSREKRRRRERKAERRAEREEFKRTHPTAFDPSGKLDSADDIPGRLEQFRVEALEEGGHEPPADFV